MNWTTARMGDGPRSGEKMSTQEHTESLNPSREDFAAMLDETLSDDIAYEGNVMRGKVVGLENAQYIDTVGGNIQHKTQGDQPITFDAETDRTYSSDQTVQIIDPGLQRRITIEKEGSDSTVVWNPWIEKAQRMPDFGDEEYLNMVCVESGNVGRNGVELAPGEAAALGVKLSSVTR